MKKSLLIFLLIVLSACGNSAYVFKEKLITAVNNELALKPFSANNKKAYYAYYLAPGVGKIYSDQTTNIFNYDDVKILMSLNVPYVLYNAYYKNDEVDYFQDKIYGYENVDQFSGTFINAVNEEINYRYEVYHFQEYLLLKMESDYVTFYARGNEYNLIAVARYMLQMAKSFEINQKEILLNFSSKETIEFSKETIELFEQVVPIDGNIQDILDNNDSVNNAAGDDYESKNNDDKVIDDDYSTDDYQQD